MTGQALTVCLKRVRMQFNICLKPDPVAPGSEPP
jgi:hypothetical protein